jgi:predicted nucleic acid-binding Zn ribbon protein
VEKVRVGFMGAHSTGKTTTVEEIMATHLLPRPVFVQSTSRDVGAAGYGINETASPLSQLLVTTGRVVKEDTIYEGNYSHVISDRTPLDSLAYTMWSAVHTWKMDPQDIYLQYSTGLVVNHMKKYDRSLQSRDRRSCEVSCQPPWGALRYCSQRRAAGHGRFRYRSDCMMPIYSYYCMAEDRLYELIQIPIDKRDDQVCRKCGSRLVRQHDLPGMVWSPTRNGGHS